MEVIFQDSIGFIYDVCRVIICKSNKRESWINAFLCDGSEEEDMLYIDNLLKKFQGIEISNKLLGYKNSKKQNALIGEICNSYMVSRGGKSDIEDFLDYFADVERLRKLVAEFYFDLTTFCNEQIWNAIYDSQYSSEVKEELYRFFLFSEKSTEIMLHEIQQVIYVMKKIYLDSKNEINGQKDSFNIVNFQSKLREDMNDELWRLDVNDIYVSFSILNRYLILKQIDQFKNGIIILGVQIERFFENKFNQPVNLSIFGNALGDKLRMRILMLLREKGEMTLTDFSTELGIVNAVALYHLDILREAKLILRRNYGRKVLYWINDGQFYKAIQELKKLIRKE